MSQQKDITTIEDIQLLVDTFYGKVRVNNLLGGIFNGVIKDRWAAHLDKMYSFWQTVLLGEHTYWGAPFPPHSQLPVNQSHFHAWLTLWHETIDELFTGERAEEAKWRAEKMAVIFLSKIEYYQSQMQNP